MPSTYLVAGVFLLGGALFSGAWLRQHVESGVSWAQAGRRYATFLPLPPVRRAEVAYEHAMGGLMVAITGALSLAYGVAAWVWPGVTGAPFFPLPAFFGFAAAGSAWLWSHHGGLDQEAEDAVLFGRYVTTRAPVRPGAQLSQPGPWTRRILPLLAAGFLTIAFAPALALVA